MENPTYIHLNPVNFLIISGVLQGVVLVLILFYQEHQQQRARRFLAFALLFVNLHLGHLLLIDTNIEVQYPFLLWFPTTFLLAIAPCIYFYTQALIQPTFKLTAKAYKHFIPVGLELMLHFMQSMYSGVQDVIYYRIPFHFTVQLLIYLATAISFHYYLKRSLSYIQLREEWLLEQFSYLKDITLSWLYRLLLYYQWLWRCWLPFSILLLISIHFELEHISLVVILYALAFVLVYLSYWIAIEGLIRNNIVVIQLLPPTTKKQAYNQLPQDKINSLKARIQQLMDRDKLFLDEELSLRKLASQAGIEPNLLSYLLNAAFRQNFYDFVNQYRVEEVKGKMADSSVQHLTLLAIAFECGFNSKATFNRSFKKVTGMSPSAYRKQKISNRI